jgi:PST family polysaccharide transporter
MQLSRGSDKHVGAMVLRGTAWLLGGRFARMAVGLVSVAILARLLTPDDFGAFTVAFMVLPLAIALLGGLIDVPVIREDSLSRDDLANLIWASVGLMAALAGGLWLAAPWLAAAMHAPQIEPVLRVSCFTILLQPFISASQAVLRRQHRYAEVGGYFLLSGVVHAGVAIALALLGCGIWSLVGGQLASLGTTTAAGCISARIPILPPRRLRMLGAWRLGGLGFSSRLLDWLTANIDTLFAVSALGVADAGIYSRAYNITTQLKEPFAAIDLVVRQAFVARRGLDDALAHVRTSEGCGWSCLPRRSCRPP